MVGQLEQALNLDDTSTKRAYVTLDAADLPPLTAEQIARLEALAVQPDNAINFGDIPPLSDVCWANAVRGRYYRRVAALKREE